MVWQVTWWTSHGGTHVILQLLACQVAPYVSQLRQFVKKRKVQQQRGKKKKDKEKEKPAPSTRAQAPMHNPAQAAGTQSIEVQTPSADTNGTFL